MRYLLCLMLCGCSFSFEVMNTATSQDDNGVLKESLEVEDSIEAESKVSVDNIKNKTAIRNK
ncbi:hypothetical protein V8068_001143 [Vibrio parahaemolyticus]|nr:hypothetical protein [Vibrio parahaemolyticus]EHV9720307.1 hypothetical protein [Vibrio parahaemolyticus]HDF8527482.1 hypothetical protein [Vibrio parahaemolyticus]